MKTASNKNKGRKGQQEVRDMLLEAFPFLDKDDINSTSMGAFGEDLKMSPEARKHIPLTIEVKRRKSFSMCRAYEQAKSHSGLYTPVVFFREDRGEWLVCLSAKEFIRRFM